MIGTSSVSNSLDPDQAQHFVRPDLEPNCLQKQTTQASRVTAFSRLHSQSLNNVNEHAFLTLMLHFLDFFVFILYTPVNNFSVMLGWVFLGLTSTKQRIECLAQEHKAVPPERP